VLNPEKGLRTAALTTDLAPHWCGGWVDWGARRRALPVTAEFGVEVGDLYVRFVRQLIQWLLSGSPLVSAPKSR